MQDHPYIYQKKEGKFAHAVTLVLVHLTKSQDKRASSVNHITRTISHLLGLAWACSPQKNLEILIPRECFWDLLTVVLRLFLCVQGILLYTFKNMRGLAQVRGLCLLHISPPMHVQIASASICMYTEMIIMHAFLNNLYLHSYIILSNHSHVIEQKVHGTWTGVGIVIINRHVSLYYGQ